MGYRREDIPGMIAALRGARKLIGPNEWDIRCICDGLRRIVDANNSLSEFAALAKDMIHESLGRPTYSAYALEHFLGHQSLFEMDKREAYHLRLRWIDKMIHDLQQYAKEAP